MPSLVVVVVVALVVVVGVGREGGFSCFMNSKTSSLSASEGKERPKGSTPELRMRKRGLPGACCCSGWSGAGGGWGVSCLHSCTCARLQEEEGKCKRTGDAGDFNCDWFGCARVQWYPFDF